MLKTMLSHDEARRFYDSFGAKQDKQMYEEAAIRDLLEHAQLERAKKIVEFGCGTGKLAARLLEDIVAEDCQYTGIDLSSTMIDLCRQRTARFSPRAKCFQNQGAPKIAIADQSADRLISTYVLDLLTGEDAAALCSEAYRVLVPGGLLCLASLAEGTTLASRTVATLWDRLFRLKPSLVGGCRPIRLTQHLHPEQWDVFHRSLVVSYCVPSEVVVARRLPAGVTS